MSSVQPNNVFKKDLQLCAAGKLAVEPRPISHYWNSKTQKIKRTYV